MKTLLINGSPRRESSNTMTLTRAFIAGADFDEPETINVADLNIKPCLGCFACWNKTPGQCVLNDDMAEVLAKLIHADVVIWSFPLYYFCVPGALKCLIDRQLPMNLPFMAQEAQSGGHPSRHELSHQRHIVISTCGFWTAKGNYDGVTSLFDHCYSPRNYAKIFCGQGELFHVPELKGRTDEYLKLVEQAGAEYAHGKITSDTQTKLEIPLFPREVFEKMADASWGVDVQGTPASDTSLNFTKQMAALYVPDGKERVLEIEYTDIGKRYQLLLTAQGSEVIADDFQTYTTKIATPYSVWKSIASGEISGPVALADGKYKVLGDFSLMLHWDELFSGLSSPAPMQTKKREANMLALLLPWMAIWITMAINTTIGGVAGVLTASLVPLMWLIWRPVVFEQISLPIVAGLSLLTLFGADIRIILPLSYGLFGVIWLVGAFTKTPLTAYYSASGYGGEAAYENPLFMQTNRILCALWGVLYLITSIWTYFLMGTELSAWTGLINSACPAIMGIFTAWFQKWYPAHRARG